MLEAFENKYNVKYYCDNTILISFPKCGRTWMRMMLARLIDSMGIDYLKNEPILSLHYSVDEVLENIGKNVNILYITRDPKDVVVSYYCEEGIRKGRYKGDISSFIRNEKQGLPKILKYNNEWDNALKNNVFGNSLKLQYEDLRLDPNKYLKDASNFLNINCNHDQISDAVQFASFDNMKKVEDGNGINYLKNYKGHFGKGTSVSDDSRRVRKGKIGGYVDYLNDPDIEYADKIIKGAQNV